ncbi:MAG TPA: DUF2071 domain-containing protein [Polyangiaceae bacterium]
MIDRMAPTRRPEGVPAGYQKWRDLLFVHWEVPVAALRPLVPAPLAIDTHEDKAYVGVVAFTMHDVRPSRFLPAIAGAAGFGEVNVRTYVHHEGRDPGVWFLSLDAQSVLAVLGARAFFHLPYFHARIETHRQDAGVVYRAERHWADGAPAGIDVRYEVGAETPGSEPGSLQHFLVERYILYAMTPRGRLLQGRVHHPPYRVRHARVLEMQESLVAADGLERPEARASELWSDGVDVEVFGLRSPRT